MNIIKRLSFLFLFFIMSIGVVSCSKEISSTTTSASTSQSSSTTTNLVTTTDPNLVTLMEVADTITIANANNITENFDLLAEYGVISITWSSNNNEVISISSTSITVGSGKFYPVIINPTNQDTLVDLEATFTLNSVQYSKTYSITLKAITETDLEILIDAANTIIIMNGNNIVSNFNLIANYNSIDIIWVSDNNEVISIATSSTTVESSEVFPVTINPTDQDTVVELEATFILNSAQYSKTYTITVKALVDDGIYRSVSTLYNEALIDNLVTFNGYVAVVYEVGYVIMDNNGDSIIIYDASSNYVNLIHIGDNVTVSGKYTNYHSLYQIKDITSQVINSSNNVVSITPIVLDNASDLMNLDSTNKLNHGKVYTVTVTLVLNGANIDLYDGTTKVAVVYYDSQTSSINALKSYVGREVTIDVLYYTLHDTYGIYVLFYGTEEDIISDPLTVEEQFTIDSGKLDIDLTLTDSLVLPTLEFAEYDTITISTNLTNYIEFVGDEYIITRPLAGETDVTGTLTVKITIGSEYRDIIIDVTVKAISNAVATDLFISEYIEGSSYNKLIELYNATGTTIDLSEYTLELYSNGSATVSQSLTLSGTLLPGQTVAIYRSDVNIEMKDKADVNILNSTVINFNGDDAIVLKHNGVIIDGIGQVGVMPATKIWGDMTIVRKSNIVTGRTGVTSAFDPTVEWIVYPSDTFTYIGTHITD